MANRIDIRILTESDADEASAVVNAAAEWYREFLPAEEIHGPEMTAAEWLVEAERMTWYGAFDDAALVGLVGLEHMEDVALIRHAYVLPDHQRRGIGSRLLDHAESQIRHGTDRIIAGTYAANHKAHRLFERHRYRLSPDPVAVLNRYYEIPEDRLQSSVTFEKPL